MKRLILFVFILISISTLSARGFSEYKIIADDVEVYNTIHNKNPEDRKVVTTLSEGTIVKNYSTPKDEKWTHIEINNRKGGYVLTETLEFIKHYEKAKLTLFLEQYDMAKICRVNYFILMVTSIIGIILFKLVSRYFDSYDSDGGGILLSAVDILLVFESIAITFFAYCTHEGLVSNYISSDDIGWDFVNFFVFLLYFIGYVSLLIAHCRLIDVVTEANWIIYMLYALLIFVAIMSFYAGFDGGLISRDWTKFISLKNEHFIMAKQISIVWLSIVTLLLLVIKSNRIASLIYMIVFSVSIFGFLSILPTSITAIIIAGCAIGYSVVSSLRDRKPSHASYVSISSDDDNDKKLRNGVRLHQAPGGGLGEDIYDADGGGKYVTRDGGNTFHKL